MRKESRKSAPVFNAPVCAGKSLAELDQKDDSAFYRTRSVDPKSRTRLLKTRHSSDSKRGVLETERPV
ncbi:hypothetical protein CEXT_303001 [Caerostris extrusa]|uniref:Uncharacterized protein n=1 Tax=Caerostris extrusa TaxID=172846 RepID=A0AAV4RJU6_CAEEX|nr:hypothetical protein CEXT_303001 [Caerostris extrusa]